MPFLVQICQTGECFRKIYKDGENIIFGGMKVTAGVKGYILKKS